MAKAKRAPDISQFAEPNDWAAATLRLRFDEVLSYTGAALAPGNVDGVHDMRVALRRLRSALRDFVEVIDEKPLKHIAKELKKNANSLGVVRDLDVGIGALTDLAAEADDDVKDGISRLIGEMTKDRETAFRKMRKTFSIESFEALRERFLKRIAETLTQQRLFSPSNLKDIAREIIDDRLDDFLDRSGSIYNPLDGQKLHSFRIAAKRLRYAIELFSVCWSDEIKSFAKELSKMQTFLGDVHDCDVWIASLHKRLTRNGSDDAAEDTVSAAATSLISRFVQNRSKQYMSALDLWRDWTGGNLVERLGQAVQE